jgi:hypothetical protein
MSRFGLRPQELKSDTNPAFIMVTSTIDGTKVTDFFFLVKSMIPLISTSSGYSVIVVNKFSPVVEM